MWPIRIAIVSDLHVGENACCAILRGDSAARGKSFIERFKEFAKLEDFRPDYLLLPGDMGERAKPEEFDRASEFVREVLDALQLPDDKLICIPGNHDVDWSVLGDGTSVHPLRWSQRYDPVRQARNLFQSSFGRASGDFFNPPYFATWNDGKLLCCGYNSSWHDKPSIAHNGTIDLDHIAALRTEFRSKRIAEFRGLKVFVIHHHIYQYTNYLWDDTSIATNAQALLSLLAEFKFDILIHGHRHVPNFMVLRTNDLHPIVILGAGSFTRRVEGELAGIVANQFHLLNITGRNGDDAVIGDLSNWAYLSAGGWIKSYVQDTTQRGIPIGSGIEHRKPFGGYSRLQDLVNALKPKIVHAFDAGGMIIDFDDLIDNQPALLHVTQELMSDALSVLAEELGFQQIRAASTDRRLMLKRKVR